MLGSVCLQPPLPWQELLLGTGCGFCFLTAASVRPGVEMAKGLTPVPVPGGAKKGGNMKVWKEA